MSSRFEKTLCAAVSFSLWLGLASPAAAAPTSAISLSAPDRAYRDYPVTVEISAPASARSAVLTEAKSGKRVACQLWRDGDKAFLTWILPRLARGETLDYKVSFADTAPSAADGVVIRKGEEAAEVLIGGLLFTRYVISGAPKPYCYPLIGPTGTGVTRNYPMKTIEGESHDHKHHRSLWFTHGNVNGVDFWSESPRAGKTVHRGFEALQGGPVMGRICALTDWIAPGGKKVCEDVRDIRFYKIADGRLLDWTVTVKATEGPVKFGDTKEGTFGLRVAGTMRVDARKGGRIVNSAGQTDKRAWGKRADWCDYYGPVEGKTVGIAVFDNPANLRHPTYWHVRTYGLFAANPFGLHNFLSNPKADGSYTIPKGGSLTFRYRVWIHRGTTEQAKVAEVYGEYANPPRVTVR